MCKIKRIISCCLIALFACQSKASEPADETPVREAVQRAIPYLQQEGIAWIEKRGCVSCHQIPFMLWSLSAAERNGFEIDRDGLQSRQAWSTEVVNFVGPAQKSDLDAENTLSTNIDTINALLLAIPAANANSSWRDTFTASLIKNQKPDGSWQACGQLPMQKRPKEETTQVTVMWTLLALAQQAADGHDQEAAIQFAQNEQPTSTEWWVVRLLLSDQLGDGQVDRLRNELIGKQREDGGWGWLIDDPSDALATGMAIYALRRTGDSDVESLRQAEQYLVSTQRENGSWSVPGTKQATRNKSTSTSDYWGTAWAVIGLLE